MMAAWLDATGMRMTYLRLVIEVSGGLDEAGDRAGVEENIMCYFNDLWCNPSAG
jgi:hypothetical protein